MTTTTSTTTTTNRGAVKGAVAAAAGVAVLLGGMGTFALWNAEGALGEGNLQTGTLAAEFGDITWNDVTPGHENVIADLDGFHMVPGDVIVGTSTIEVVAQGENLVVVPQVVGETGVPITTLSDSVTVGVVLDGVPADGFREGTTSVDATITIAFDEAATGEMGLGLDLSATSINLQQVAPSA